MASADDKRRALKAAGWRRFDRAGLGERWRPPDPSRTGALGVTLATAWRNHRRTTSDQDDRTAPTGGATVATRTLAHAPARDAVAALTDAGVIDDRVLASVGVPTDDPSVLLAELVNNGAVTPFALLDVLGGGQPTDDETVEADVSGGSVIVAAHDG